VLYKSKAYAFLGLQLLVITEGIRCRQSVTPGTQLGEGQRRERAVVEGANVGWADGVRQCAAKQVDHACP